MLSTRALGVAACGAIVLAAAPYAAGTLYHALIGAGGRATGYLDIFHYWQSVFDGRVRGIPMRLAIASAVPVALPVVMFGLSAFHRRPQTYGDAHFASEPEIRAAGLRAKTGLLLGRANGRYLCADGQVGALLFAPPRSGKGVGFGVPNLLNWSGSALVTDPKLDNYTATSGFRAAHGQRVVLFNPLDPEGRTERFNPLDYVSQDPGQRVNDLQKLTIRLVPTPETGEAMWATEARDLIEGVLLYLMDFHPPATLGDALRLIRGQADLASWIEERLEHDAARLDTNTYMAFAGFLQKAPKERSGVLSNAKSALSLWANPLIDRATAATDFDPGDLRRTPMTIYIGIPPSDIDRLRPLLNVFVQQTFDALLQRLPGADEPHRVLALLDEFTALGRLSNVEKGIAYFASYNISLAPIIQDLSQLRAAYGRDAAESFLATSHYRIAFAPNSDETASYISRQLGQRTIVTASTSQRVGFHADLWSKNKSRSHARRELMLPHEVMTLPRGKELVMVEGRSPVYADKIVYFRERAFKQRVQSPAPLPPVTPEVTPAFRVRDEGAAAAPAGEDAATAGDGAPPPTLSENDIDDVLAAMSER